MKVRIRTDQGQKALTLDDDAAVGELTDQIAATAGCLTFDLKYGYPPRPIELHTFDRSVKLSDIGINLNGEQLLVSKKVTSETSKNDSMPSQPLSLSRRARTSEQDEEPQVASPLLGGRIILRIMPDDNSCLFRAFSLAFYGSEIDAVVELRSKIAQHIQANPDTYTEVILDKRPDEYCREIQNENAWGGAIELGILSQEYDVEICSIDVQSLRVDRFNEGKPMRIILVYSGIHYDTIVLSLWDQSPDDDMRQFDAADNRVLETAVQLCSQLQDQHYYTDTQNFSIKCNDCGVMMTGESGATEHARQTNHYDFGEA